MPLNPNKDFCLSENNKSFCMFAWVHSNIHTTGEVKLCCIDQKKGGAGYISADKSWADVWNDNGYKQIRLNMLEGKPVSNCEVCYRNEKVQGKSYRTNVNSSYGYLFDEIVSKTEEDGSAPMDIRFLDIRWSNICNFKCRMCGPSYSSQIAKEHKRIHGNTGIKNAAGNVINSHYVSINDLRPNFIQEILPHINSIKTYYFAGGEPLVTPEHYELLQILIDRKMTDVGLIYNTNLSTLTYKEYNVTEMWDKFKYINLQPSLDSFGARAEYLRTNTDWNLIEKNIQTILDKKYSSYDTLSEVTNRPVKQGSLNFSVTVSAWNVLTYFDFYEYILNRFNLSPKDLTFYPSILRFPVYMSIAILPKHIKQKAIESITAMKEKYQNVHNFHEITDPVLNELNEPDSDIEKFLPTTKKFIDDYDKIRNTSFVETFPELEKWYKSLTYWHPY